MKNIIILGSTGSIGVQALEVIENHKDKFNIVGISANQNVELLIEQAKKHNPKYVCIADEGHSETLNNALKAKDFKILYGREGLLELSKNDSADIMLNALVGSDGMEPTINAIKSGVNIALSNKESLVMAGELINEQLKIMDVNLYPVDSEHSAIWQCLVGEKEKEINKLILTGSGGPFRTKSISEFHSITREEALKHPNWSMGNKITIDSATMMNKGLELIEAYWLFDVDLKDISILIHPESIIHSMVEFVDGSIKAQLGVPSMEIPIQYALTYPNRFKSNCKQLDLSVINSLNFEKPDLDKFKCIRLAHHAIKIGGSCPVVLNVANDILVSKFLNNKITFLDIPRVIEDVLEKHDFIKKINFDDISYLMHWTKEYIKESIHD